MALTFASLYSGCGGFDLGFAQAGFRCIGAFDADPLAIQVHRLNLRSNAIVCDLTTTAPSLPERPDVLLAGSPCQGFSTAGTRNPEDPRNSLLVLAGQLAVQIRPRVFVAENVVGVMSGEHKRYWDSLRQTLEAAGYRVADVCCDANQLGVPQRRRRMVMFGSKQRADIQVRIPPQPGGVVSKVIESLVGLPNHRPVAMSKDSSTALIAARIAAGQKLSNVRGGPRSVHTWHIPEVFGRTSAAERSVLEALVKLRRRKRQRSFGDADPVSAAAIANHIGQPARQLLDALIAKGYVRQKPGSFDLTHTFNGKFRRLSADAPSPTVDTRFGDPRYFLHPSKNRGLTVREAARLQGFPDDFILEGPVRSQYRLVGNAVPPPMAYHLATFVRDLLLGSQ